MISWACRACGSVVDARFDVCPACRQFATCLEVDGKTVVAGPVPQAGRPAAAVFTKLSAACALEAKKIPIGLPAFDEVLTGGLVPGQVALLAGDPGAGKSTLCLQAAYSLVRSSSRCVAYISGEESLAQIGLRARRLGADSGAILTLCSTDFCLVLEALDVLLRAEELPSLIVIDSIQTFYHPELSSATGSVQQVLRCASELVARAKNHNVPVLMLCQINKESDLAGPKALEHLVDTAMRLALLQEGRRELSVSKNRFGACEATSFLRMTETGLFPLHETQDEKSDERKVAHP